MEYYSLMRSSIVCQESFNEIKSGRAPPRSILDHGGRPTDEEALAVARGILLNHPNVTAIANELRCELARVTDRCGAAHKLGWGTVRVLSME
jgi:hypothetical protein